MELSCTFLLILPQRPVQNPVGIAFVVLLALGTVTSWVLWSRETGHPDRRAFVAVIISIGALGVIINILAPTLGWWGGPVFEAPLFPLAVLTALRAMFLLAYWSWLTGHNFGYTTWCMALQGNLARTQRSPASSGSSFRKLEIRRRGRKCLLQFVETSSSMFR